MFTTCMLYGNLVYQFVTKKRKKGEILHQGTNGFLIHPFTQDILREQRVHDVQIYLFYLQNYIQNLNNLILDVKHETLMELLLALKQVSKM